MARGRLVPLGVAGLLSALAAFVVVGTWGPATGDAVAPVVPPEVVPPPPVVKPPPSRPSPTPASQAPAPPPAKAPVPVDPQRAFLAVTRAHGASMQACYDTAVAAHPTAYGRAELTVWIDGGRVVEIEVPDGNDAHLAYTDCLIEAAATWDLLELPDGSLSWPMVFQPPGGW